MNIAVLLLVLFLLDFGSREMVYREMQRAEEIGVLLSNLVSYIAVNYIRGEKRKKCLTSTSIGANQ